ncbi:MAG TPA: lysophospholipase [Cerasibacillus sp.]|uniref:alpha/beta hydrolase n=1 Tax=Cerasibacillus sp. TaxID=2498711 RepID=UPI002F3EF030
MRESLWIEAEDETAIHVMKWTKETTPRAIVQLSHGMVEHIERYDELARFFVKHDLYVYGNDHRGHGQTGEHQGKLGFFAERHGFDKVTHDLYMVTQQIKLDYPETPIILLGHSMGSFLARKYIQLYSQEIVAVVLSGTTYASPVEIFFGKQAANVTDPFQKAPYLNQLIFGLNNRKVIEPLTDFDWLTGDRESVQTYIADPLCGFVPTGQFFRDLFSGLADIHNQAKNSHIPCDLPMLFISGEQDPVGKYGKNIWKAANVYKELGMSNIMVALFHEGRHELFHEINKQDVFQFVYKWIDDILTNLNESCG